MKITLQFKTPGYICDPYRVELHKLIEIQKTSGMMRARSDKKKRESLESYLKSIGMNLKEYEELEKQAKVPFYYQGKNIIIPYKSVYACIVNASDEAPSRLRIQNIRASLKVSDFVTNKQKEDGIWERFAVVKSGSGQTLSNQRGFRSNAYIMDFEAKGTIEHNPEMVKPESIIALLEYAGQNIGIGASRSMGFGRFLVKVS